MGKVDHIVKERLLKDHADRSPNLLRVYKSPNGEVVIHYRNLKIVLLTPEEQIEWVMGFKTALDNLGDHFKEDL
jgi:hypothetical protein